MKKNKLFACGIAIGLISALGLQAFGAPTIEKITAYINHEFEFEFDGVRKAVPEGYHILVYEGRSYVPAKFVAENLGGTVVWNEDTKVIGIQSPEPVVVTVPAVTVPENDDDTSSTSAPVAYDYKVLPITKYGSDYELTVYQYVADDVGKPGKLFFRITNKEAGALQLDPLSAKYTVGVTEYSLTNKDAIYSDNAWYNPVHNDELREGYISVPLKIKELDQIHVELKVDLVKDYPNVKSEIFTFDIQI